MFTGIVEVTASVVQVFEDQSCLWIELNRPKDFQDLKVGDSLCCHGVCLTLERIHTSSLVFCIGVETLEITKWTCGDLKNSSVHLERSLKWGDRVHGHLVSGHVEARVRILRTQWKGPCLLMDIEKPSNCGAQILPKSSVALNGVSLTVNEVESRKFQVCLIPETLRKTNFRQLKENSFVNLETDYYLKHFKNHKPSEFCL